MINHITRPLSPPRDGTAEPGPATRASRPLVRSTELLGSRGEIQIEHAGALYTLRRTSKGKLILTK